MKKILFLLIAVLALSFLPVSALADLGNFNDYDSGDYDYDYDYDYDDDDDYDFYYDDNDYSGGGGGSSPADFGIAFVAFLIIVMTVYSKCKKDGSRGGSLSGSGKISDVTVDDHTDEIVSALQQTDENFSSDKFIGWVKEVFITLQNAWSARDFAKARPFEKEELYRQHEEQIKQYIESNRINVLDRINVNQAYLYRYVREKEYEYLTVYLQCRMTDYIKDANTGEVIKGNPKVDSHMRYLYTFMRKVGVTTDPAKSNNSVVACPNCGAPTNITSAGKCEYCGFIVTTGDFDWVLSNIESVKAGYSVPKGGVIIRDKSKNN